MSKKYNRCTFGMGIVMVGIISCALISVSFGKPRPKTEKMTGHVLGYVPRILKWIGDGPDTQGFVFIIDPNKKTELKAIPIVVSYQFFSDEAELPGSFFDYSQHFEITLSRNNDCDTTVGDFFYLKTFHDHKLKKPSGRIYLFRLSSNAPKMDFADDFKLPCYEMRPGNYSLLK